MAVVSNLSKAAPPTVVVEGQTRTIPLGSWRTYPVLGIGVRGSYWGTIVGAAPQAFLYHCFIAQDEPEPAIRKSYQAVERHGETIRVRDTVLLKSGPRKTSTPYVAKISALWENPESGTYPPLCLYLT